MVVTVACQLDLKPLVTDVVSSRQKPYYVELPLFLLRSTIFLQLPDQLGSEPHRLSL